MWRGFLLVLFAVAGCSEGRSREFALAELSSHACEEGYIVFEMEGSIHRMRADGTDVRRLTADPLGRDTSPRWSPDGRRIAFLRAGDLWIMDADGGNEELALESGEFDDVAWSPDGRYVAAADALIAVYDLATGGVALVAGPDEVQCIAWSQDSQALLYAIDEDVRAVRRDGTGDMRLFRAGGFVFDLALSPDPGHYVAVARSRDGYFDRVMVEIRSLNGARLGSVPFDGSLIAHWYDGVFWSPDAGCLGVSPEGRGFIIRDLVTGAEREFPGYEGDWIRSIAEPPDAPPVASFTATPETVAVGEWVVFDPSASWDDLGIVEYVLDYDGDGIGDLTEPTPLPAQWKYDAPGSYAVELRVRDTAGQWGTATRTVTVKPENLTLTLTISFPPGVMGSVIVNVDGLDVSMCTATCTVETLPGATATLTAGLSYSWAGCDAVLGNVGTLTMNSDRTVTLLQPS